MILHDRFGNKLYEDNSICGNKMKTETEKYRIFSIQIINKVLFECDVLAKLTPTLKLREAIKKAIKENVNLSFAGLLGADLSFMNLTRVNLSGACLYSADLSGCNCYLTNFTGANLYSANIRNGYFNETNLERVILTRANLLDSLFYKSKFNGANLTYANFTVCHFFETSLDKSIIDLTSFLGGTSNVHQERFGISAR